MSAEWELSKENTLPIAKGRSVGKLNVALEKAHKPVANSAAITAAKVRHEESVTPASLTAHSDPLVAYLNYINYITDNLPADTQALFLILERCTRAYSDPAQGTRYHSDPRYIRICIMYADKTSSPLTVFKFLHARSIGIQQSLFWIAWAWVAEKSGDYKTAEKIFKKAMSSDVTPMKMLEARYKQFVRRMSRHWIKKEEEQSLHEETPTRPVLAQSAHVALSQRQANTTAATTAAAANNNPAPFFTVFTDDEAGAGVADSFFETPSDVSMSRVTLATESDGMKENVMGASTWNDPLARTSHAVGTRMDSLFSVGQEEVNAAPAFEVFVDEGAETHKSVPMRDEGVVQLSVRGKESVGVAEMLEKDPLRYLERPEKVEKDERRAEKGKKKSGAGRKTEKKIEKTETTEKTEKEGEKMKCGFSKRLVTKDKNGFERCFEEGRMEKQYYTIMNPSDTFGYGSVTASSAASPCGSMDSSADDISMGEASPPPPSPLPESPVSSLQIYTSPEVEHAGLQIYTSPKVENAGLQIYTSQNVEHELFAKDQEGLESAEERASHIKQKHSRSISAPMFMNSLSFEDGTPFKGRGEALSTSPVREAESSESPPAESPKSPPGTPDEDQTINTKLAMADLGLMFGGAAATAHPDSPKPMFGVANPDSPKPMCFAPPRPPPSPSSSPVRTALSNSVSVKLTNADILRQTLVNNQEEEEEEEKEKEKEKEKEEEDDIYGDAEGPSFEVYCEDPPICEPVTPGFAIFTDEGGGDEAGEEPAAFSIFQDEGDVSCIHAADNTMLSNMSMAQTPAAAGSERGDGAVEYDDEWTRQIKQSVKKALQPSAKSVSDLRHETIPRMHSRDTIRLGKDSYYLKKELGRGAYGVVYLVKDNKNDEDCAMKVQKPVGSLAHEFLVMRSLQDRLGRAFCDQYMSIPRSLSIFSDGACKVMPIDASVDSKFVGLNFVDIVNVFRKSGEPINELVVAHYTVKIMEIMNRVHVEGRVLHGDIKPDNWIVGPEEIDGEVIQGAGIKLIDFGKALDLTNVKGRLLGEASGEDMQCPNMIEGESWLHDCDWMGLCATSHIMLFGAHLEVSKDVKGRWRPNKSIRRYWQQELWQKYFDELLNDGGESGEVDFEGLIAGFKTFIEGRSKELKAMLRHQVHLIKDKC